MPGPTNNDQSYLLKHLRHNVTVNVVDGAFFGMALGFASFVTVIPLFISTMTSSAILIGLIPAIHSVGWQLPQLFMARRVARQTRFKPLTLTMTIQERLPFFGLAALAWFLPSIGARLVLPLAFVMLIWQGLGGGFTATAWTSLVGKIVPGDRRGTFFGLQSAAANLLASFSAVAAGLILARLEPSPGFALCFLLAGVAMLISFAFLAWTREPHRPVDQADPGQVASLGNLLAILRRDANFRWFLAVRMISQLAVMAYAFYTVYAVDRHGMSVATAGLMTGVMTASQIAANPIMGWLGDRWSYRAVMTLGILAAALSALLAWWAPDVNTFYLVFALAGISNVAVWTLGLAMILEFGNQDERPAYIGLANTLVAPATILAPLLGGWLADRAGYPSAFLASAVGGLLAALLLQFRYKDPAREKIIFEAQRKAS